VRGQHDLDRQIEQRTDPSEGWFVPSSRTSYGRALVRKLQNVGVVEEVERLRKAEVYAVAENEIADRVLALPDLLVKRLGRYRVGRARAR
jgi:hypothetical protein